MYDLEAAVLSGGEVTGYKPISNVLRKGSVMTNNRYCLAGAQGMDRVTIYFYRRPLARAAILVYVSMLHCWLLVHKGCVL